MKKFLTGVYFINVFLYFLFACFLIQQFCRLLYKIISWDWEMICLHPVFNLPFTNFSIKLWLIAWIGISLMVFASIIAYSIYTVFIYKKTAPKYKVISFVWFAANTIAFFVIPHNYYGLMLYTYNPFILSFTGYTIQYRNIIFAFLSFLLFIFYIYKYKKGKTKKNFEK